MLYAAEGRTDGFLDDSETLALLAAGLEQARLDGQRVLVLIPDETRTCPLPLLFRCLADLIGPRAAKLDFLIALGTHQPLPEERINNLLGITAEQRAGK
ncbi:MAG: lactate racemase domain-containing protein, partial [Planctomycetota bacterium]|nr:lactate racemase domain-containing protein [Planctomycetota bacterium]